MRGLTHAVALRAADQHAHDADDEGSIGKLLVVPELQRKLLWRGLVHCQVGWEEKERTEHRWKGSFSEVTL